MSAAEVTHDPAVPPRIGAAPSPVDPVILSFLAELDVSDVCDAVGPLYTMSPRMRALYEPVTTLVGVAYTVKAPPGDNLTVHGGLSLAGPDSVLVVDWHGYRDACGSGAQAVVPARARGMRGIVIDGGWRDVDELRELDVPIFGVHRAASSPAKQAIGEINVAVSCGDVVVEPGDVIVGGSGGIAVIPRRSLTAVVDHLRRIDRTPITDRDRTVLQAAADARFERFEAIARRMSAQDERKP